MRTHERGGAARPRREARHGGAARLRDGCGHPAQPAARFSDIRAAGPAEPRQRGSTSGSGSARLRRRSQSAKGWACLRPAGVAASRGAATVIGAGRGRGVRPRPACTSRTASPRPARQGWLPPPRRHPPRPTDTQTPCARRAARATTIFSLFEVFLHLLSSGLAACGPAGWKVVPRPTGMRAPERPASAAAPCWQRSQRSPRISIFVGPGPRGAAWRCVAL